MLCRVQGLEHLVQPMQQLPRLWEAGGGSAELMRISPCGCSRDCVAEQVLGNGSMPGCDMDHRPQALHCSSVCPLEQSPLSRGSMPC